MHHSPLLLLPSPPSPFVAACVGGVGRGRAAIHLKMEAPLYSPIHAAAGGGGIVAPSPIFGGRRKKRYFISRPLLSHMYHFHLLRYEKEKRGVSIRNSHVMYGPIPLPIVIGYDRVLSQSSLPVV